jgi:hypothetical protein
MSLRWNKLSWSCVSLYSCSAAWLTVGRWVKLSSTAVLPEDKGWLKGEKREAAGGYAGKEYDGDWTESWYEGSRGHETCL